MKSAQLCVQPHLKRDRKQNYIIVVNNRELHTYWHCVKILFKYATIEFRNVCHYFFTQISTGLSSMLSLRIYVYQPTLQTVSRRPRNL